MSSNRRGNVPPATVVSVSQTDDMPDSPPGEFTPRTKRERATDIASDATGEAEGRMGDGSVPMNELDDQWMQVLAKTPTGRHVRDYLAHVASACSVQDPGIECPIDQVTSYRRALIRALEMSEQPFGLPRKLPRFIFVANLCGRKLLLTSARSVLLQLMSHSPNGAGCVQQAMLGIKAVMRHMDANPDDSVLMTYSMPFQVEMSNLFWDVRTIRRMPNGRVFDGQIAYQLGGGQARAVASTSGLEHESSRGELDAIVEGFRANMACVDMDINVDAAQRGRGASAESTDSAQQGRVAHLEQMVNMLQHERKKMHVDHRQEMDNFRVRVQQAVEGAQAASAEAYAQERTDEKVLADQLGILQLEFDKTKEALGRKDIELKKLKAKSAAADLEWDGERKDMQSRTALMEAACNQATKQLAKSNSERDKTLKRQETQHAQTLDEMERRYQRVVLSERAARAEGESLMERLVTLSKTMEGHDAADEAYQSELMHLKRANRVLGGLVKLGGCRFDCALEFAKQYPVAIARAEEAEAALKVANLASVSARAWAARLQAHFDSLKEADASNAKCSAPVMTDAATMTQHITSKADLELGEIQTAHCKLQDDMKAKERELAETKAEFARAVKRAAKKNPPPDFLTEQPPSASAVVGHPTQPQMAGGAYMINNHVHIGNGGNGIAPVPIDLGVDPNADPSVEHAIAQAVGTLRHLADMARESSRHKAAATEGWATVRALQQYSAYAPPPPGLQGPIGMMYHGQHMAQGGFIPGHPP